MLHNTKLFLRNPCYAHILFYRYLHCLDTEENVTGKEVEPPPNPSSTPKRTFEVVEISEPNDVKSANTGKCSGFVISSLILTAALFYSQFGSDVDSKYILKRILVDHYQC